MNTNRLINEVESNFPSQNRRASSTNEQWDHSFDLNHNDLSSSSDDDIFHLARPSIFNQVHNINDMVREVSDSIDTNQCQLLTGLLPPPPETPSRKRKRVSPPRQLLPLERIVTRSVTRKSKIPMITKKVKSKGKVH